MLVIENRNTSAAVFKDSNHLLKESMARIQYLTALVLRIVAMFPNNHHPIHRQFRAAKA